jgi:hypothetical protein
LLLLLVLSATLILSGCGGDAPAAPANTQNPVEVQSQATEPPAVQPTEALAALVNGQPITLAAFQIELQRQEAQLASMGVVPADRGVFETSVLSGLIDQVLIEQAATIQGLAVTEDELSTELALDIETAGGEAVWRAWLAENGLTEEEYRASIRSALLTGKIRDLVIASVPDNVEQVHARHILVSTEAEAQAIYQQLQAGTEFGELALAHSLDVSTRDMGGDLGWFAREQLLEPVVAEVAFGLEPGQISAPFASSLGYHVVQTLERVADRPRDDSGRIILDGIIFDRWLQSLRDQATVQRFVGG